MINMKLKMIEYKISISLSNQELSRLLNTLYDEM